jgi:pyrimidine-nucleoside phosphorylase
MLNMRELILSKRDGGSIAGTKLKNLVTEFSRGNIPDYQMSAFLMAVFFRGMDDGEINSVLDAMIHSGTRMHWDSESTRPIADKHSTGGVGDKTSFIVLPLLVAAGCHVPMIAGRGLGHTGGTLDKLEALPGFRTRLNSSEMTSILKTVGGFIGGQTGDFVPADGKMYALRDVTGTVESIPLIVCSILSKKVAAGVKHLVMDVKTGSGAFMEDPQNALKLAAAIERAASNYGVAATCMVTDMSSPLGSSIGNALEIDEALDILEGKCNNEVAELSLDLAAALLSEIDSSKSLIDHRLELKGHLLSGRAREIFVNLAVAQGASLSDVERVKRGWIDDGVNEYPIPLSALNHASPSGLVLSKIHTRELGEFLAGLGAGRHKMTDTIHPRIGIRGLVPLGTRLMPDDPVCFLRSNGPMDNIDHALLKFFEFAENTTAEDNVRILRAQNRVIAGASEVRSQRQ